MKAKNYIFILLFFLFAVTSCEEPVIKKPENLIKEEKMIEMMLDMHLAEATFQNRRYQDSVIRATTSTDFYYSVLNEYNVADTVFEKSFVYYSSNPRKFEKMYQDVMNKLSETEQQYSGRKNELLDLGTKKEK